VGLVPRLKLHRIVVGGLVLLGMIHLAACGEMPTSVKVSAGPSFTFSGYGHLAAFLVYAPRDGRRIAAGTADVDTVVWQIAPAHGYFEGVSVHHLNLTYGVVPSGYIQVVPAGSKKPELLDKGIVYAFYAETTGAEGIFVRLYMGTSGPIRISTPGLALSAVNRRWVEVDSRTGGPFVEPTDLEEYVREHTVKP
jgi:hypothetical protein